MSQSAASPQQSAILATVRSLGPISSTRLAELTGINRKSASTVMCQLWEWGKLRRVGVGKSLTGIRPYLYELAEAA